MRWNLQDKQKATHRLYCSFSECIHIASHQSHSQCCARDFWKVSQRYR